jgi:hypothetical protein
MKNKDIDYKEEHQNLRKKLWIDVYVAYVSSANAIKSDGASHWSDIALERFDERFEDKEEIEK